MDLNQLAISYDNTLSSILENHAPLITRTIIKRPIVPWLNDDVKCAKRARRQAERKWRRTRLHTDFQQYKAKKNQATYIMNQARAEFYKDLIHEAGNDQRKLFKSAKALFKQKADLSFLDHRDPTALANDIRQFFVQKIECIRSELIDSPSSQSNTETSTSSITPFDKFKEMNEEDVKHLITKSGEKSCALDPMPTSLVIECLNVLCPIITRLINLSLDSGLFPDNWKHAEVRPCVKNNSSSDLSFSNLRPISNLTFISKLTEQAVSDQTHNHLSVHNLYPKNQSAYRKFHSTETALTYKT